MRSNRLAMLAVIAGGGLLGYSAGGVAAIADDSSDTPACPVQQHLHDHDHDHPRDGGL